MVNDIGEAQARAIGGLLPLAKCSMTHSERDTHQLLAGKLGLALPIPLTTICGPQTSKTEAKTCEFPILRLRDWAAFLLKSNCWHVLAGLLRPDAKREQAIWASWWERFRQVEPDHEIFTLAAQGTVDLSRCAAILLHGDEGRGRRRQAFLVLSFLSVLGRGSAQSLKRDKKLAVKKTYIKHKTNFMGHTYTTRYLAGVLPRAHYGDDESLLQALLAATYEEANFMSRVGVKDRHGNRFHMVLLRTVGDWPFLHKAGRLNRTYANTVKKVNQIGKGICHLCRAGEDAYPFEQIGTRRPLWATTRLTVSPFKDVPHAACVPHSELASHYAFDLFHTWHLGVGKNFLGSVLALMSDLEEGNVEDRFNALTKKYKTWCKETKHSSIVAKLTKDLIQWPSTKEYPSGGWYKADLTTNLMQWFESMGGEWDEPLLSLAWQAARAINEFFRFLYARDAWLSAGDARYAGELAFKFLRRYEACACAAFEQKRALFVKQPKLHPLQETALNLVDSSSEDALKLNPLLFSNQCSEDFIGRPSRLSRRVGTRQVVKRVLERYLQASYSQYVSAGYLIEPRR